MKKIPFYIGVLLVIPIAVEAGRHKRATLHNGYGVGSIMAADMAILHEAIKENIQQQALLVWMDAQGKSATHQAAQAIDTLINHHSICL
jgi:tRNA G37 N-methylase TrmD